MSPRFEMQRNKVQIDGPDDSLCLPNLSETGKGRQKIIGEQHESNNCKKKIEGLLKYSEFRHDLKNGASQNQHGIMLVCAPSHGNLGDHAISIAELQALHPELKYIDLTDRQTGRIEKLYGGSFPNFV